MEAVGRQLTGVEGETHAVQAGLPQDHAGVYLGRADESREGRQPEALIVFVGYNLMRM